MIYLEEIEAIEKEMRENTETIPILRNANGPMLGVLELDCKPLTGCTYQII